MEPLAAAALDPTQEGCPEAEQVLASPSLGDKAISATDQNLTSLGDVAVGIAGTLVSIRGTNTQAAPSPSAAVSVGGPRRQKRTAEKKRAGGWQPSPRLSWLQVKRIDEAVHRLAGLGVAPTHCITIMPPASIAADNKRKRFCDGKVAHIGEALKRHDQPHIGLTTFENPLDADLHANHLVFVPRGERNTIERFHSPPSVHVEAIYDLPGVVAYVTKERRRMSPRFREDNKSPLAALPARSGEAVDPDGRRTRCARLFWINGERRRPYRRTSQAQTAVDKCEHRAAHRAGAVRPGAGRAGHRHLCHR